MPCSTRTPAPTWSCALAGWARPTTTARVRRPPTCSGSTLHEAPEIVAGIRERFLARGLIMPEINRRQALVPAGGVIVPNLRGSAPGLWILVGDRAVALLPGPPREMQPMLDFVVSSYVAPRWGASQTAQRAVVVGGRS